MATWRVMLNAKLWDQARYQAMWLTQPEVRLLAQSRGTAKMAKLPKKGDTVVFVLKGHIVMRGLMHSEGFVAGDFHQHHSCNKGSPGERKHEQTPEFAWITITEIDETRPKYEYDGQRTWRCIA